MANEGVWSGMMKSQEGRSSSSCAACKFLKRRCSPSCQFAPYFRADEPKKFAIVHKVFGASNVSKILNEVAEDHREEAVNSLVYEAEVRLQDPVYGCIGAIATLQHKMVELEHELNLARARLASFVQHSHQNFNALVLDPQFDYMTSPQLDFAESGGPGDDRLSHENLAFDDQFGDYEFP